MPCKDRVRHLDYTQGPCWKPVLESEDRAYASAASGDADLPVADGLVAPRDHAQSLPELLHPILGALARSLVLDRESNVEGLLKRLLLD